VLRAKRPRDDQAPRAFRPFTVEHEVYLKHLSLANFRNYVRLELELSPGIILVQGENAQGKTNLLEAIYYLATARSPYATADRELINWLAEEEELTFSRLVGQMQKHDTLQRLEITLLKEPTPAVDGHSLKKQIRINGVPKRVLDLIGQLNVVIFLPQDIDLVAGSPGGRRRYLDTTICQFDPLYCRTLRRYGRVLTQRNHLLRQLQERRTSPDQLRFWDEKLAEDGAHVVARRREVVAELEELARAIHLELTGQDEHLSLRYEPSVRMPDKSYQIPLGLGSKGVLGIGYSEASIREAFVEQLRGITREEIQRGMSLIGPHRDELRFLAAGVDMRIYGSRGQQRTVVLALKLAEAKLLARETGEQPVMLLDEVMSELDEARRRYLTKAIKNSQQAILTTTHWNAYSPNFLAQATLLRVQEGRIEKMTNDQLPMTKEGRTNNEQ
jgi:DNA replication and repair protein RecF